MAEVNDNAFGYSEEPTARKIKSISPHFKPSSCQKIGSNVPQPFKKLVTLKIKAYPEIAQGPNTMPNLAPKFSLGSKQTQPGEDISNASSVVGYSRPLSALSKVKPLASRIGSLQPNPAKEIGSKTSLSNSIDGITSNMPETLILGPRVHSLGQPGSSINKQGESIPQPSTAVTLGSGINEPVKVFPTKSLYRSFHQDDCSPVNSYQKSNELDQVQEALPSQDQIRKASPKRISKTKIRDNKVQTFNPHLDDSPGGFSRYAAKGVSSPEGDSPNMLMSPNVKGGKANLNSSGHLLELVDPNDGFDLDILSSIEQQGEDSEEEEAKGQKEKKKKMTRIFNFDRCTLKNSNRVGAVRKSVDCGELKAVKKSERMADPDFNGSFDRVEYPIVSKQSEGDKGTSKQKKVTSKPIPVNFEKLRLMSKELQANKNNERASKTIISPAFQLIEDL